MTTKEAKKLFFDVDDVNVWKTKRNTSCNLKSLKPFSKVKWGWFMYFKATWKVKGIACVSSNSLEK